MTPREMAAVLLALPEDTQLTINMAGAIGTPTELEYRNGMVTLICAPGWPR